MRARVDTERRFEEALGSVTSVLVECELALLERARSPGEPLGDRRSAIGEAIGEGFDLRSFSRRIHRPPLATR
jgi:hypothetical protein